MLISLDMNLDDELDYKEMARGMKVARQEKREDRRKEISRESTSLSQRSGIIYNLNVLLVILMLCYV